MKAQKHWTKWIVVLIIMMIFTSCTGSKSNQKGQIIVAIDGEKIIAAEVMIYFLQVKEDFEKVGGTEVWEIPKEDFTGGIPPEQVAKNQAYDNLIKNKILDKKASSLGISLKDSVIEETKQIATDYFNKIPKEIVVKYSITNQIVEDTFLDFRLAKEVSDSINSKYVPKEEQIVEVMLLDEDYKRLKEYDTKEILTLSIVQHVLTNTAELNTNDELVPLSEEAQKKAYNKIQEAYKLAQSGDDFNSIINQYSEEIEKDSYNGEYKLSIVLLSDELKAVLEDLKVGQVSEVAKTEYGYHMFKLIAIEPPSDQEISSYEAEFKVWEETLKEESIKTLKQQAFNEIYEEWKKETLINLENELWEKMSLF
ncbi:MAG: hypothetical protein CVV02_06125 [Firmicutes bacterium HGW-Firmicutes-7]|nr:MAG: hypothetical protein CVV02_06125 [Firmicutes bacterium HGW-Firmicutes-7]